MVYYIQCRDFPAYYFEKGVDPIMAENYSPEIAKAVENFLSENGWGYEPII